MITVKLENRTLVMTQQAVASLKNYIEHMGHHYADIRNAKIRRLMMKRDYNKIISKVLL